MAKGIVFICLAFLASVHGADRSLVEGSSGDAVVEEVVDVIEGACMFDDDKLFLRRLAHVETNDGTDANTYRDGYNGGIWQVDETIFEVTKRTTSFLTKKHSEIKSHYNIDWPSVSWNDLRKPLYSGLAARLYFAFQSEIPTSVEDQAVYWKQNYRHSADVQDFITKVNQLESSCNRLAGVDLVFVLDGSGSIGSENFEKIKSFTRDVVGAFDIGADKNRVSLIHFSHHAKSEFHLNAHMDKYSLQSAIDQVNYEEGGHTNTGEALRLMSQETFQESNGARPRSENRPRVAIVLTDGKSQNYHGTVAAARMAQSQDVHVYAIGIGSEVNEEELTQIASTPDCTHFRHIQDFTGVTQLTYAIEQTVCKEIPRVRECNPCTEEALKHNEKLHPHQDPTKYIECDASGQPQVKQCGNGEYWNINMEICVVKPVDQHAIVPAVVPASAIAVCSEQALAARQIFHPHPDDTNKYIKCDECGNGWIVSCGVWKVWDPVAKACVRDPSKPPLRPGEVCRPNPCTQSNRDNGLFHFPGPDKFHFCQCDDFGKGFYMPCPPGLVWDNVAVTCNWP